LGNDKTEAICPAFLPVAIHRGHDPAFFLSEPGYEKVE
jgi:hypothetical protein